MHTHKKEELTKQNKNTAETNDKYTKYTSVFITFCKHFVLHFKNATIKLLAHLCTKQITCNACYKALWENTNSNTRNKSQKCQHRYINLKTVLKIITNCKDTEPKHYNIEFKESPLILLLNIFNTAYIRKMLNQQDNLSV